MEQKFEKTFEFEDYSVIITYNSMAYRVQQQGAIAYTYFINAHFKILIDDEKDGGKIQINWKDRWGSEMQFIHFILCQADLKGMFDFIAKGYGIF